MVTLTLVTGTNQPLNNIFLIGQREAKRKNQQIKEIHFVKGDTRGVAAQDKNEFYNSVVILLNRFCRARIHH